MKIGVDARALTRPLTGIGRYTFEMCKVLSSFPEVELQLYSPSPIVHGFPERSNIEIKTSCFHSSYARQIWSETVLPSEVKKNRPDVFWGPAHCLPRFLPKEVPSVVTIHDLVWKFAGDTMRSATLWLERFHMPFAVKKAQQIIADSKATAEAIKQEFQAHDSRITVITPGVTLLQDKRNDSLLQEYGIDKDYFLFVGTLEPRKNLQNLLKAYSSLPVEIKNQAQLIIAGGQGWGKLELEKIIRDLNLKDQVRLIGYVDEFMLATLYANARFLAMPSLYEGFGLPLAEAMSFGVPVLTSNNSSMPEVCQEAGLLVDPLDIHSISKGLIQLITDKKLHSTLASFAKTSASRFDWRISGEKLCKTFEEMLNQ